MKLLLALFICTAAITTPQGAVKKPVIKKEVKQKKAFQIFPSVLFPTM